MLLSNFQNKPVLCIYLALISDTNVLRGRLLPEARKRDLQTEMFLRSLLKACFGVGGENVASQKTVNRAVAKGVLLFSLKLLVD